MTIYSGFSPWKMVIFHSYVSLPEGIYKSGVDILEGLAELHNSPNPIVISHCHQFRWEIPIILPNKNESIDQPK